MIAMFFHNVKKTLYYWLHYVLFPLPDIKKETYETGKNYMKIYFGWLRQDDIYTAEQLMKIFEDEHYWLDEAIELLEKLTSGVKIWQH